MFDNFVKYTLISDNLNFFLWIFWICNFSNNSYSFSELLTCHSWPFWTCINIFLSNNSCILWNSSSSINIVTSAHDNLNTCCLNLNDWINNGISEWILDTKDTNSNQIFFKAISIFFFLKIIVSLFELLKFTQWHIFIANQNCSISLICIILNSCPKDIFMSWLSSTSLLYNIIKWYKAFWILAITSPRFFSFWNSSFSYHVEKNIWCSLSVYSDISIIL